MLSSKPFPLKNSLFWDFRETWFYWSRGLYLFTSYIQCDNHVCVQTKNLVRSYCAVLILEKAPVTFVFYSLRI